MDKPWVYEYTLEELRDMYRRDLQINRHKLEVASQNQGTKFEKWYSALEEISADLADEQIRLTRIRSKVDLMIRRVHPDLKETGVLSKVNLNVKVKKQNVKISRIKRYQALLKGAVEMGRQRKSMIQVLKDLYVASYFDKIEPKHATGRKKPKKPSDRR